MFEFKPETTENFSYNLTRKAGLKNDKTKKNVYQANAKYRHRIFNYNDNNNDNNRNNTNNNNIPIQ